MKKILTPLIIVFLIGIGIGYFLSPDSEIEETIIENTTIEWKTDTLYVDVIKEIEVPATVPDTVEETVGGLVRSTKRWELENMDVVVVATAPCAVELFELKIENIKPLPIEWKTKIVTVEKLKTVTITPPWYKSNVAGVVYGVVGTLLVVYAAGSLTK